MNLLRLIQFVCHRSKAAARAAVVLLIVLVLADALPALVDKTHAHTRAERIPAFWAIFGFAASALTFVIARGLAKTGIVTREDYDHE